MTSHEDISGIYIFMSSNDSNIFHPDNQWDSFIIELNEQIKLDGYWVIALCDVNLDTICNEVLFVYCNLCDHSNVNSSLEPILKVIYPSETVKFFYFQDRYYVPIKQSNFSRIKIYIRDVNKKIPSSRGETLHLTVHLKRLL